MSKRQDYGLWDKELKGNLLHSGLTLEQAGLVIGIVAEHRQTADQIGFARGFCIGYEEAKKKFQPIKLE